MIEYVPDTIRKYPLAVVISLVPLLIANLLISPLLQNPDTNLTIFETKDKISNISHVDILIQNVGNEPSKNILLYFASEKPYTITSSFSTDSIPKSLVENNTTRASIERLAPQSFALLRLTGPISNGDKTLWFTSDKESKIVQFPYNVTNTGISTIDFTKERGEVTFSILGFSLAALFVFRYVNFYRSESKRRDYLGIHEIPIVRYRHNITLGIVILVGVMLLGIAIDAYMNPLPVENYKSYTPFSLANIVPQKFIQLNNPASPTYGTLGNVIQIVFLFVALSITNRDIKLPKFDWALKSRYETVKLNQIHSSFMKSEEFTLSSKPDLSKKDKEIFIVKDNNEIMGLFSMKEAKNLASGKKSIKSILQKFSYPHVDKTNYKRENFVMVDNTLSLGDVKKRMEEAIKRYAVIINAQKDIEGIIAYDDLFGKPDIFA